MRTCPYCLSNLSVKARKCKYCGEWIDSNQSLCKQKERYREDKVNGITSSVWRFVIVAYFFITIPLSLIIIGLVREAYRGYYGAPRDRLPTIIWTILIPLIYIVITDILRGAIFYITTGKYRLYLRNKMKPYFNNILN